MAGTPSQVRLEPLVICREQDQWLAGRPETGMFVALPGEAVTFLRCLQAGEPVAATAQQVRRRHGVDIDAPAFVATLLELGFVAAVDGVPCGEKAPRASLPWLRPAHVQWLFSGAAYTWVAGMLIAGLAVGLINDTLVPGYEAFFVTTWQGVNLAINTGLFLAATALHEWAHLAAARAQGVHARIGLGTRLQLLTAQTTVTGLWAAPRRVRFRVYLAGIACDLLIISVCQLVLTSGWVSGWQLRCWQALALSQFLAVSTQFALYMRTDMYLVLQEALRCRNLYGDAVDYLGYLARRARRRPASDPTLAVPVPERTPIKAYAVVMGLGTVVSLALFTWYGAPVMVTVVLQAAGEVGQGWRAGDPLRVGDGLLVLLIQGTLEAIFVRVFVAKHRHRWARRRTGQAPTPSATVGPVA